MRSSRGLRQSVACGVIINLPVDVMRRLGRGPVIAVDVAADRALTSVPPELEDCSPWQWLAHGRRYIPSIAAVLIRAAPAQDRRMHRDADLLLRPPLASIGMLDWQAFDRAVEIGYRHTLQALANREPATRSEFCPRSSARQHRHRAQPVAV